MSKIISSILIVASLVSAGSAYAFNSPISFGIAPPVQFPQSEFSVTGLRVSGLWGRHRDMYGIDLGLGGNITDQRFVGIAVAGLFNVTHGQTTGIGLQAAGITNINTTKANIYGLQLAGILNNNIGESSVNGIMIALINKADHTVIRGAQIGLYNKAQSVYGLQIGVVNVCDNLHGLQIGLANFHTKGLFVVSPILNVGF
jgi:hypothetical protein